MLTHFTIIDHTHVDVRTRGLLRWKVLPTTFMTEVTL